MWAADRFKRFVRLVGVRVGVANRPINFIYIFFKLENCRSHNFGLFVGVRRGVACSRITAFTRTDGHILCGVSDASFYLLHTFPCALLCFKVLKIPSYSAQWTKNSLAISQTKVSRELNVQRTTGRSFCGRQNFILDISKTDY